MASSTEHPDDVPFGYVEIDHDKSVSFRTYFNLVAGGITFVCNVYLLLRIACKRSLRSQKEYTIIGADIFMVVLFGLAYFDRGFIYMEYLMSGTDLVQLVPPSDCLKRLHSLLYPFVLPGSGMAMLFSAFDRMLSVTIPTKYRGFGTAYALGLMAFAYVLSTPIFIYVFINAFIGFPSDFRVSPECDVGTGWMKNAMTAIRFQRGIATVVGATFYIPILVQVYKIYIAKKSKTVLSKPDRKKLIKTTTTIVMITTSHLVLFVLPDIVTFVDTSRVIPTSVLFIMITSQGLANVVIYLFMLPELRPTRLLNRKTTLAQFSEKSSTKAVGQSTPKLAHAASRQSRVGLTAVAN